MQLTAILSHPTTVTWKKRPTPCHHNLLPVVVERHKISPDHSLLQIEQSQFSQPIPIRLVLQTLHQLGHAPKISAVRFLAEFAVQLSLAKISNQTNKIKPDKMKIKD